MIGDYLQLADQYFRIRQILVNMGWSNDSDDDVLDAIVELDSEDFHYTDEDLDAIIGGYRTFEEMFPRLVDAGDGLVKQEY